MSLKNRLFSKDLRRLSLDLTANLHHALKKLCKDKPIRLSQLKAEYDHYFKDRISTKPSELVTAALKSLEKDVVAVKVYKLVDNREMTDMLLGLRSASYAANMHDEDNPQLSKDRLLNIIKDCDALGIQVRELEKRYVEIYGTQPSYLPYKSIKELLHRTPDVELASSGKNLRVRTRQVTIHSRKSQVTKIPSLNRNSMTSSLRARKTQDFMSLSICKITDPKPRPNLEMTNSILIPSRRSPDESPISSGSTSPNGSVDMTVSMVLPRHFHNGFENDRVFGKTSAKTEAILQSKEVMTTILNDFPAEGMSLKALTDEFLSILGPDFPLGMTTVEFLSKEFKDVIKLEADENGVRVFKTNSPLLPRRTIADVYTKLALQSNRKPSDRVLKVLKDIYKKRDPRNEENAPQSTPKVDSSIRKDMKSIDDKQKAVIEELQLKLSSTAGSKSRLPIKTQHRSKQNVIDDIKVRLKNGPIDYPTEFLELTKNFKDDNQSLLVDLMSSLNLCLKPQNGRMILQMS